MRNGPIRDPLSQRQSYPIATGLMVIVLAIGPRVCGFKQGRERWIFKGNKNSYHYFFKKGEVKPSVPCREILRHVKYPFRYDRDTDRQNSE
jgi:hypothetical protein